MSGTDRRPASLMRQIGASWARQRAAANTAAFPGPGAGRPAEDGPEP